ncbi:MAG TPA: cell division protein FtsL [Polyangia bacterium]|nr:cell division protein FtsL [Polyangia bacterium]
MSSPTASSIVETDARHRRGIGVGAFLLAIATVGAVAHVGVRGQGIEVAYALGREKQINTKLEEERRRLNIEIGMLKDPVRVVSFARDKLKMGPPAPADIVRLVPGQVLGAPPAVTAPAAPKRAPRRPAAARPVVAKPVKVEAKAAPASEDAPAADEAPRTDGDE